MIEPDGNKGVDQTFQRRQITTFSGIELNGFRKVLAKMNPDKPGVVIKYLDGITDEGERAKTEMAFRVIYGMAELNAGIRNTAEFMAQLESAIVWQTGPNVHDRQVEFHFKPGKKGI